VEEKYWRELWDVLLKPFNEQRTAYRRVTRCARAPDLFFGAKPRPCESEEPKADQTESATATHSPSSTPESHSDNGIALPEAAQWMEYWATAEIPTHRTFVDFAEHLSDRRFPRCNSCPDLDVDRELPV
jgi:hypothetical protein